ncbi:hypothetical protein BV898_02022 [Hypsibius exemplaris]|uniref:Uncharacterized protein n=1 Tax=Hypsibius exemplaris TaxID=2072580 RepID=A0A1W0X9I7_HYPEX|nr:hypothetical protein BV898_02022 [Hypsibius exemplaris]
MIDGTIKTLRESTRSIVIVDVLHQFARLPHGCPTYQPKVVVNQLNAALEYWAKAYASLTFPLRQFNHLLWDGVHLWCNQANEDSVVNKNNPLAMFKLIRKACEQTLMQLT